MKKVVLLSGFEIDDNNRGSAALGYGSIAFLKQKGFLSSENSLCMIFKVKRRFWKRGCFKKDEKINVHGEEYNIHFVNYLGVELKIFLKYGISMPFTPFGQMVRNLEIVAATNGGDGFSDIYTKPIFLNRLKESWIAMKLGAKVILMPQTLGPFSDPCCRKEADRVMKYAEKIYVRDDKFVVELDKMHLAYEREKDLSAYMQPQVFNIDIKPNSIGINISGLAYSNSYRSLSGQFDCYPELINKIIKYFQKQERNIYLIPHSYNYLSPEPFNDDLEACRLAYQKLDDKSNVYVVDVDLKSPQIKYVISKMSFFVGTRMHANFAAIFMNVPVFGLAYSYKFEGAFVANGLSRDQVYMINNMREKDIETVLERIERFYSNTFFA